MSQTVIAVYECGILRPEKPLPLSEGETVEITIYQPPPPSAVKEEEGLRRIRDAKSLDDLWAAVEAAPEDDLPEGYDFDEALNHNRRQSGDYRVLYEGDGILRTSC
jgi:predicted DNA-binding antitoxin AbrB/MazE fold protein